MTATLLPDAGSTHPLAPLPLACVACGQDVGATPQAICPNCLGPLEPVYDPSRALPSRADIEARPRTLWRYREWLPFQGEAIHATDVGWTPLVDAPALARRIGVARVWLKLDAHSFPSLSFKDRVVATAINAAEAFGLETIGCASTGNLANAVAAAAARAGKPAWIFVPYDLELGKLVATSVFSPRLVRVRGTYDDVNRLCAQVADRFGWGIVNVNLRAYYGEGSKTMAFEIAEQLGWRLPTAVVTPMAGGSLVTKLRKGFTEARDAGLVSGELPRQYGAQAEGCAPIVRLAERGDDVLVPEIPQTIARSLAIGNPADGRYASRILRGSGGAGQSVSDAELVAAIRLLAESTGIFAETAGGVTLAATLKLAERGHFRARDELVICLTGHGLKTVEAVQDSVLDAPVIAPKMREVAALISSSAS
ncbi:MAG: threonine synthase [Gemmatimonadota bacterium]